MIRSKSVTELSSIAADLRAGHRPVASHASWSQERIAIVTPTLPDVGGTAVHDAAAVGDQPGHEDRHDLGHAVRCSTCRRCRTGPSAHACSACRASPTSRSGASASSSSTCSVDPGAAGRVRGHPCEQVMEQTAEAARRAASCASRRATSSATGGFVDTANQRLQIRHVPSIGHAGGPPGRALRGTGGREVRLSDVAELQVDHQPLWRRRRHQRRPGPHAHRREVPVGEHARRDPRRRGGLRGAQARAWSASRSTRRSSGRRPSSRSRSTTSTSALLLGSLLVFLVLIALPVRLADGADQPRRRSRCR